MASKETAPQAQNATQSAVPKLSPSDLKAYNRIAELMDLYVSIRLSLK